MTYPQFPVTADVSTMFNTRELAQTVTHGQDTWPGILTTFYTPIQGGFAEMQGHSMGLIAQAKDAGGVAEGDTVSIGADSWRIVEIERDNTNVVRFRLEASQPYGGA